MLCAFRGSIFILLLEIFTIVCATRRCVNAYRAVCGCAGLFGYIAAIIILVEYQGSFVRHITGMRGVRQTCSSNDKNNRNHKHPYLF